jgi:hypothetical protein
MVDMSLRALLGPFLKLPARQAVGFVLGCSTHLEGTVYSGRRVIAWEKLDNLEDSNEEGAPHGGSLANTSLPLPRCWREALCSGRDGTGGSRGVVTTDYIYSRGSLWPSSAL